MALARWILFFRIIDALHALAKRIGYGKFFFPSNLLVSLNHFCAIYLDEWELTSL